MFLNKNKKYLIFDFSKIGSENQIRGDFMKLNYVMNSKLNERQTVPPHAHNCYELVYYFSGSGKILYDSTPKKAQRDFDFFQKFSLSQKSLVYATSSYILFSPHIVHNERHNELSNIIFIGFELSESEKEIFSDIFNTTGSDFDKKILHLITKIQNEYLHKKKNYETLITSYITQICVELTRKLTDTSDYSDLNHILAYINEYYYLELSVEDLAQKAGYSPSHFRKLFIKCTNVSPKLYILNKRIEAAKKLLKESNLPINVIANNCGYSDSFQFSALFKKHTGFSPSSYRTQG